jgi:hypothetical protein
MKKYYTTSKYKFRQKRKLKKLERRIRNKKVRKYKKSNNNKQFNHNIIDIKLPVIAPSDFRLVEKTESCLMFFRNLRNSENHSIKNNTKFVVMSLKEVTQIDYGTISILTAISDELKYKGILLKGDFPFKNEPKKFIIESGFLNNMYDSSTGRAFPMSKKSELIFFEKGCGVLTIEQIKKLGQAVKNVVIYLTNEQKQCLSVLTIVKEICGNSIEWSGTDNKQWLLGIQYEENNVIFTVTDIGKGILGTLHKKFGKILIDFFTHKSDDEILLGAFKQKYGSSTQEVNRNKGLPAVKQNFDDGIIKNLKVLTNNVILHFDNNNKTKSFQKGSPRFKGTFYQWEMTKESINKIKIIK